jgi:hypothetical protein
LKKAAGKAAGKVAKAAQNRQLGHSKIGERSSQSVRFAEAMAESTRSMQKQLEAHAKEMAVLRSRLPTSISNTMDTSDIEARQLHAHQQVFDSDERVRQANQLSDEIRKAQEDRNLFREADRVARMDEQRLDNTRKRKQAGIARRQDKAARLDIVRDIAGADFDPERGVDFILPATLPDSTPSKAKQPKVFDDSTTAPIPS